MERFSRQTRSGRATLMKPVSWLQYTVSINAMEEGILDVELMDCPVPGEGKGEAGSNGGELNDGVEGLVVVHSRALGEALKDPTGLVAVEGAVRGQFVGKEPLAGDRVGAWWTRHQVPSVVGQQGRVLLHSATPVRVGEGCPNGGGDRGGVRRSDSRVSRQDQLVNGAENAGCAVSHHRVVHGMLGAGQRGVGSQGSGSLVAVVVEGRFGDASRARRRGWVSRSRASGPLGGGR
jgi:hypothetical protein